MNRRFAPVLFVVTIFLAGVAGWMINDRNEPPALVTLSQLEVDLQDRGYEPATVLRQIHHETQQPTQSITWTHPDSMVEVNVVDGEITTFGTEFDWCSFDKALPLEDMLLVGQRAVYKAQQVWPEYENAPKAPEHRSWDLVLVPLNEFVDETASCVHQHEIP
jgi:hypothetical protein